MQNALIKKLNNKKRKLIYHHNHHYNDWPVSAETLAVIESSMKNFKLGIVSDPIDLSEFED